MNTQWNWRQTKSNEIAHFIARISMNHLYKPSISFSKKISQSERVLTYSYVIKADKPRGMLVEYKRIRKSQATGEWFMNSSNIPISL